MNRLEVVGGPYSRWGLGMLAVIAGAGYYYWYRRKWLKRLPPGPNGWPIVGNIDLMCPDMYLKLAQLSKVHGDVLSVTIAGRLTVVLCSPRAVREAFVKQSSTFAGRPYPWAMQLSNVKEQINNGSYSKDWVDFKDTAMRALKQFGYANASLDTKIQDELETLMKVLSDQVGMSINPRQHLPKMMANIVFSILVNRHYMYEDPEFLQLLQLVHKFQERVGHANLVDIIPLLRFLPWKPITLLKETADEISEVYRNFIEEHRRTFDPDNLRDVIDVFLKEKGVNFDKEQLVGLFFSFVGDAVDSLPEALVWLILYVIAHAPVQEKIHAEIDEVIGRSEPPSLSHREKCPYIQAVIMEALRLASFIPLSEPHRPLENTTLFDFYIPKEANVFANIYSVHMDRDTWDEPEVFNPERFLDGDKVLHTHEGFLAYSVGKRQCLGNHLSNKVLFLFITNLLQNFEVSATTPVSILPQQRYGARKAQEFEMRLEWR